MSSMSRSTPISRQRATLSSPPRELVVAQADVVQPAPRGGQRPLGAMAEDMDRVPRVVPAVDGLDRVRVGPRAGDRRVGVRVLDADAQLLVAEPDGAAPGTAARRAARRRSGAWPRRPPAASDRAGSNRCRWRCARHGIGMSDDRRWVSLPPWLIGRRGTSRSIPRRGFVSRQEQLGAQQPAPVGPVAQLLLAASWPACSGTRASIDLSRRRRRVARARRTSAARASPRCSPASAWRRTPSPSTSGRSARRPTTPWWPGSSTCSAATSSATR